jgi:hypothetical protein
MLVSGAVKDFPMNHTTAMNHNTRMEAAHA